MGLERTLRTRDIVLFNVAAIIGLRWIALAAANGPSSLFLWILAALVFFIPQAFAVVALSSAIPEEGGLYVWTSKAFGPRHGFLAGWLYWISNVLYFPTQALSTVVFALYVFGMRFANLENDPVYVTIASLVLLGVVLAFNIVGMKTGRWVQNIGGVAQWLPALALVIVGAIALARFGSATPITAETLMPRFGELPTILFFSSLCFGFAGMELAPMLAGEVHEPRTTIPRAIVISGITIALCYIFGTLALLWALPARETSIVAGINQAVTLAGARVGLGWLGSWVAVLMTISGIGGLGAWLVGSTRLPFVAGLDRYLPEVFSRTHRTWKTPYVAMLFQGVLSALFVVIAARGDTVKSAYLKLVSATLIVYFIPYLYMFASAIRLEAEIAREPRAIPIPGGRAGSRFWNGLGFLTTVVAIVLALIPPADAKDKVGFFVQVFVGSFGFLGAGYALFALAQRRWRREKSAV